ncbi:hypothetical protein ACTNEN_10920 [Oribacterium sp. HCP28S3_H8]|uniref:hypothetical protein n=1 Tax=Oribacterium sp. HCP28S3_H8 TaxID=3438945 RepID=UPI003F8CEEC5
MKKYLLMLLIATGVMMTAAACGGKSGASVETTAAGPSAPESTAEETDPDNGMPLSKQPDPTAEVLASIVVYAPDDSGKVSEIMDAASELTEANVIDLLKQHGTIGDSTTFVSLDTEDTKETVAAGPGVSSTDSQTVKNGTLTLSGFTAGKGLDEATAKQAVIDTFAANFGLGSVKLVLK